MLKNVNIGLLGGLGNQLFQLSYALYLQKTTNLQVSINPTSLRIPPLSKNINRYELEIRTLINDSFSKPLSIPKTYYQVISSRLKRLSGVNLTNNFWIDNEIIELQDQELFSYNRVNLYGYFNNLNLYKNYFSVICQGLRSELGDEISFKSGKLALHFRRGDAVIDRSGIQSEYYENLLHKISQKNKISEITIFTDDILKAKEILKIEGYDIVYDVSFKSKPLDVLARMSSHEIIVCANSTFSFWAGALSTHKSQVFFPKKNSPIIYGDNFKNEFVNWTLV